MKSPGFPTSADAADADPAAAEDPLLLRARRSPPRCSSGRAAWSARSERTCPWKSIRRSLNPSALGRGKPVDCAPNSKQGGFHASTVLSSGLRPDRRRGGSGGRVSPRGLRAVGRRRHEQGGPAGRHRVRQRQLVQERRERHVRREGVHADDAGRRRARRADRGRQHRGAGSRGLQRRLRRRSQRGGRRAARLVLHARAQEAGGRGRRARGRPHAVQGRARSHEQDRPPPHRRRRRPEAREAAGLHDRGRPQHAALAQAVAGVEAAHGPGPLSDREGPRDRLDRGHPADGAGGAALLGAHVRHDQLRRRSTPRARSAA